MQAKAFIVCMTTLYKRMLILADPFTNSLTFIHSCFIQTFFLFFHHLFLLSCFKFNHEQFHFIIICILNRFRDISKLLKIFVTLEIILQVNANVALMFTWSPTTYIIHISRAIFDL